MGLKMMFNWTCPYCNRPQTAIYSNVHETKDRLKVGESAEGDLAIEAVSVACVNSSCRKTTINLSVGQSKHDQFGNFKGVDFDELTLFGQRILPLGAQKPQPEFIPVALREDYYEACLIRDLSPKAAATLIRRCLQGMIRDFCGIAKSTLLSEIEALRGAVSDGTADRAIAVETVDAIDHVRGIGNIGAHMEKDIDHIVPVEPGEAQALIGLVEMLFEEWYVARRTRQMRLAEIAGIADDKKAQKSTKAVSASDIILGKS